MERVFKYKVANNADLLFVKKDIENYLKDKIPQELLSLYIFGIMELGTNLFKHAKEGEIWLLKSDEIYFLSFLDKGGGIKDLEWAMKKGTTTYNNSLGLGLYQLSQNDLLDFSIFSSTNLQGTVSLLKPKDYNPKYSYLILNYMDLKKSGDFIVKKGKFFLMGDVSGHGLKAYKTAEFIKKFFLKNPFSCILVKEFFEKLHKTLIENKQRSAVLTIAEYTKRNLSLCGVGNIVSFEIQREKITFYDFKSGIIGESFSSITERKFSLDNGTLVGLVTDGVEREVLLEIKNIKDPVLFCICALYFSDIKDDKSILIFKGE